MSYAKAALKIARYIKNRKDDEPELIGEALNRWTVIKPAHDREHWFSDEHVLEHNQGFIRIAGYEFHGPLTVKTVTVEEVEAEDDKGFFGR